jgi:8-oxo-dGTP pyrophosphatase MutT (NUDIX family)
VGGDVSVRAAGVLCVAPDGAFLLCQRARSRVWATPGGHVERGEKAWEAAIRELLEETRFSGELQNFRLLRRTSSYKLFVADTERFVPVLDHEHVAYGWFPPDRLPQHLHPRLLRMLALRP